jgi:hypothetical protein
MPSAPTSYTLTSTAVTKSEVNEYPWHEFDWLLPHEPIRREMLRAQHAISLLDLVVHPWHAERLFSWLDDYFFRAIHFHHDNEEHILGPYYAKLGANTSFGKVANHAQLVELMNAALAAVAAARGLVSTKAPPAEVKAAEEAIRSRWAPFHEMMFAHLAEEEVFWPPVYLQYGEEHSKAVVRLILKKEFTLKGKDAQAGNAFVGSLLDALGAYSDRLASYKYAPPASAQIFGPWASVALRDNFMATVPFVPRVFIFPRLHRVYITKWRTMIESIGAGAPGVAVAVAAASKSPQ